MEQNFLLPDVRRLLALLEKFEFDFYRLVIPWNNKYQSEFGVFYIAQLL